MTLIDDINQSVSQMSNNELLERIKELRMARRVNNPIRKTKTKTKTTKALTPEQLLATMDADQLSDLLKQLEEAN
jgi:hypothetical protein